MCKPCAGLFKWTVVLSLPSSRIKSQDPDVQTITCSNFIKYSTKDKIEELNEEDLMKMFDLLIKNEW